MIDKDALNKILSEGKKAGHDIKVRDVCYILLCRSIDDKITVFRSLFDKDGKMPNNQIMNYVNSDKIKYLGTVMHTYDNKIESTKKKRAEGEDITFDENLAYMLKLKKDTEDAMKKNEIDKKDGLKILADLTVKLNDKFNISEEVRDQVVIVENKYDDICPVCSTEISRRPMSKQEAMEKYDLVERSK